MPGSVHCPWIERSSLWRERERERERESATNTNPGQRKKGLELEGVVAIGFFTAFTSYTNMNINKAAVGNHENVIVLNHAAFKAGRQIQIHAGMRRSCGSIYLPRGNVA